VPQALQKFLCTDFPEVPVRVYRLVLPVSSTDDLGIYNSVTNGEPLSFWLSRQ